jgi:RNA polymerase sigma-70 factor (ECF subfamily)
VKSRLHAALARLTEDWAATHEGAGKKDGEESGVHIPSA